MHNQNDDYYTVRMLTPSALKLYGLQPYYVLANVMMLLSYTNVCYLNYRNYYRHEKIHEPTTQNTK